MVSAQKILETLVAQQVLDSKTGDEIRQHVLQTGQDIEEYLMSKRLVSELQYAQAKAKAMNVPFVIWPEKGFLRKW